MNVILATIRPDPMMNLDSRTSRQVVFVYEHVCGGGMAGEDLPESWAIEGRDMLEAAVLAFADAGCDVVTTADARFAPHLPAEVIPIDRPDKLHEILRDVPRSTRHGLLIAPETEGILERISTIADLVPGWNLGSSAEAVALCGDKRATARHLRTARLPHPQPLDVSAHLRPYCPDSPYVVKPVDGAGSLDTFRVDGIAPDDFFDKFALERARFLVQPFVPGTSAGISFLCDGEGEAEPVAACLHEVRFEPVEPGIAHIVCDGGGSMRDLPHETVERVSEALRTIPGLRGWAGVDVVLDGAGRLATILEINPRLTSSFVWAINRTMRSEIASRWLATARRSGL